MRIKDAEDEGDEPAVTETGHSEDAEDEGDEPAVTGTPGFAAPDAVASLSSEVYSVGATLEHEVRSHVHRGAPIAIIGVYV